jgi:hypothetical protein
MDTKKYIDKAVETFKTTAHKTATTLSILIPQLKKSIQEIKAELQKAEAAKTSETPPTPSANTQATPEETQTNAPQKSQSKDEGNKPQ